MGSPISCVIVNIFMHFEKEALRKTPKKPEVWFRYVDDTFVMWRHGRAELRKFLIFLQLISKYLLYCRKKRKTPLSRCFCP